MLASSGSSIKKSSILNSWGLGALSQMILGIEKNIEESTTEAEFKMLLAKKMNKLKNKQ